MKLRNKYELPKNVRYKAPLSLERKEYLKMYYGVQDEVKPLAPLMVPSTPMESLSKAGEFVIREKQKGMLIKDVKYEKPVDVYKDSLVRMMLKQQAEDSLKKPEVHKPSRREKYEQFWFTTEVVKKSQNEIRNLPWRDLSECYTALVKFEENIATIIRTMKRKGLIEIRGKSNTQLISIMREFVVQVRQIRESIIKDVISKKQLYNERIPKELKSEFPDIFPHTKKPPRLPIKPVAQKTKKHRPKDTNKEDMDFEIVQRIQDIDRDFPPQYKLKKLKKPTEKQKSKTRNYIMTAKEAIEFELSKPPSRVANSAIVTRKNSLSELPPIPHTPYIITRPFTRCTSPRDAYNEEEEEFIDDDEFYGQMYTEAEDFWKESDPLKREGEYVDTIRQLRELTQIEVDMNFIPEEEFEDNLPLMTYESKEQESSNINKKPLELAGSRNLIFESIDRMKNLNTQKSTISLLSNKSNSLAPSSSLATIQTESNDVKYLYSQCDMLDDVNENQVHEMLKDIWDRLGFTVVQKLNMVVKYSEDIDESSKLCESLLYWQNAEETFNRYNHAYHSIKDYFRLEYSRDQKLNELTYTQLNNNLTSTEDAMIKSAEMLKTTYGDDFLAQGKKIQDLISSRRLKISMIKTEIKFIEPTE